MTGAADTPTPEELERIYRLRFDDQLALRTRIWGVLAPRFFQRWVQPDATVLDLGCGYGEFINSISARRKLAMDLNTGAIRHLRPPVEFLHQDCSVEWPLAPGTVDVVFSSNFLEHLPSKAHVERTLEHARRALRPGGRLILMGPNIRLLAGAYWDFWDHHVAISDLSLVEALRNRGFDIERSWARFLPYTMAGRGRRRLSARLLEIGLRVYLSVPVLWRLFGRQFLVIAKARRTG
jgi:SAM-dependent methyltransferase